MRYHLTLIRMMIIHTSSVLKSFRLESNTLGANFCDMNASEDQDLMDEKVVSQNVEFFQGNNHSQQSLTF